MKREWRDFILDIDRAMTLALEFMGGMSADAFMNDEKTSSAVIRQIEIIGEAVKHIPDSVKKKYPDVPWKTMAGMRDRLIHAYFGVDIDMVYVTCTDEIPCIQQFIKECIGSGASDT